MATEQNSTHTPGPWIASKVINSDRWSVDNRTGLIVADCGQDENEYSRGNARLIAAAPDMLAALKSLAPIVEEIHGKWDEGMRAGKLLIALMDPSLKYRPDVTAIHAAITKAEG